jgi:hypothetical protein
MPLEEFLENGVHFSADLKDLRSENAGGRANYVETISEREHEDKDTDTTEDEADGSIKRENEETGTTEEEADNSSEFVS